MTPFLLKRGLATSRPRVMARARRKNPAHCAAGNGAKPRHIARTKEVRWHVLEHIVRVPETSLPIIAVSVFLVQVYWGYCLLFWDTYMEVLSTHYCSSSIGVDQVSYHGTSHFRRLLQQ